MNKLLHFSDNISNHFIFKLIIIVYIVLIIIVYIIIVYIVNKCIHSHIKTTCI